MKNTENVESPISATRLGDAQPPSASHLLRCLGRPTKRDCALVPLRTAACVLCNLTPISDLQ